MDLSPAEIRVLGSLVEKQLTTPLQYPLTLNALTLACSQSSNRDPVVDYDEPTVESAVTSVKIKGLARFVHPSHGRSALRYAHALDDTFGLGVRPLALLAVLMLRGPQTPGELRSRTERMVGFSDLHEVQAELDALATRSEPLVLRLPRAPGRKEDRYHHLLADAAPEAAPDAASEGALKVGEAAGVSTVSSSWQRSDTPRTGTGEEVEALRAELVELRTEVEALRRALDDLREQLGA